MCASETNELTKRQLSAQTENKMVGGKTGNKISKLCAGQATKNVLEDGSTEPVWAHWAGTEKRQMDEAQKRNLFRHLKTENCV